MCMYACACVCVHVRVWYRLPYMVYMALQCPFYLGENSCCLYEFIHWLHSVWGLSNTSKWLPLQPCSSRGGLFIHPPTSPPIHPYTECLQRKLWQSIHQSTYIENYVMGYAFAHICVMCFIMTLFCSHRIQTLVCGQRLRLFKTMQFPYSVERHRKQRWGLCVCGSLFRWLGRAQGAIWATEGKEEGRSLKQGGVST